MRPYYAESREPSVKNDFARDYGITIFNSEREVCGHSTVDLSSSDHNSSTNSSYRDQIQTDTTLLNLCLVLDMFAVWVLVMGFVGMLLMRLLHYNTYHTDLEGIEVRDEVQAPLF